MVDRGYNVIVKHPIHKYLDFVFETFVVAMGLGLRVVYGLSM